MRSAPHVTIRYGSSTTFSWTSSPRISFTSGTRSCSLRATVAMRFSMVDKNVDRLTGRVVEGSDQPVEVTEVWTFVRPRGANWELSAIQQT